jgi:hypothetical protein
MIRADGNVKRVLTVVVEVVDDIFLVLQKRLGNVIIALHNRKFQLVQFEHFMERLPTPQRRHRPAVHPGFLAKNKRIFPAHLTTLNDVIAFKA